MRRHLLAIAGILTVATGCDNVAWGGIDVQLIPPPSTLEVAPVEPEQQQEATPSPGTLPPVLLAGYRDGSRATLTVVGEVAADGLRTFPDTTSPADLARLTTITAAHTEWVLFSEGVRVGRLIADSSSVDRTFCRPRATISGVVELVPSAGGAQRLLALPEDVGRAYDFAPFRALQHVYDQRVATLSIAGDAIPRLGAAWPAEGTLAARQDVQAFHLTDAPGPSVAGTFLYQDTLAIAPATANAYALFVMGSQVGGSYREAYVWYRPVATDGKGAPRYFNHLDWDGDGDAEILLDVFGADHRWYASLEQREGEWVRAFQDPCGSEGSAGL